MEDFSHYESSDSVIFVFLITNIAEIESSIEKLKYYSISNLKTQHFNL